MVVAFVFGIPPSHLHFTTTPLFVSIIVSRPEPQDFSFETFQKIHTMDRSQPSALSLF